MHGESLSFQVSTGWFCLPGMLVLHNRACCAWSLLYNAVLHSQADFLYPCHVWFWMSDCSFFMAHSECLHWSGAPTVLFCRYMAGATWNSCCLTGCSVYTKQPCTMSRHFMQSRIPRVVHVCLAVTSHVHFWQNDWILLCATVVTRGRNRYGHKSQHRKLTLEKKIFLPLLLGFKPTTFRSWVWCSTTELFPLPMIACPWLTVFVFSTKVITSHCSVLSARMCISPCIANQHTVKPTEDELLQHF